MILNSEIFSDEIHLVNKNRNWRISLYLLFMKKSRAAREQSLNIYMSTQSIKNAVMVLILNRHCPSSCSKRHSTLINLCAHSFRAQPLLEWPILHTNLSLHSSKVCKAPKVTYSVHLSIHQEDHVNFSQHHWFWEYDNIFLSHWN